MKINHTEDQVLRRANIVIVILLVMVLSSSMYLLVLTNASLNRMNDSLDRCEEIVLEVN